MIGVGDKVRLLGWHGCVSGLWMTERQRRLIGKVVTVEAQLLPDNYVCARGFVWPISRVEKVAP